MINARDATPDGGTLTIETTNVVLPEDGTRTTGQLPPEGLSGDCAAMIVTDTGSGMSPDVMAHAFEPFFTTKPVGVGTGLGLSMVDGFVHQSGGDVQLRSVEGKGTTVTIYLPRYRGTNAPEAETKDDVISPAIAPAEASGTGHVILAVDDEEAILVNIVEVFETLGYTMLSATDGASALAMLEANPRTDLLITDVGLPGAMNGRQLADAARQLRPDLKVLFITGNADRVLEDRGPLEQGMQVMLKPFLVNELVAKAQDMLGGIGSPDES